jgi:hypothetical protein
MAHRRSPRRSGDSESAGKNIWTSPGPTLKKAKNKRGSIFNCSIFINVFRELSKHTTYHAMCVFMILRIGLFTVVIFLTSHAMGLPLNFA